jgi:hypothetical protein
MKSEIDIEDAKEAADEQARADDEHARESHFRYNKSAANPCVAVALAGAAIGVLQSVVELDAGNLEGGEETEEDSSENGNQRSETDDGEIHMYVGEERDADGGQVRENACTEKSKEQAERGTAAGENDAFGKHLANETGLSSSERGANGDFFLA